MARRWQLPRRRSSNALTRMRCVMCNAPVTFYPSASTPARRLFSGVAHSPVMGQGFNCNRSVAKILHGRPQMDRDMNRDKTGLKGPKNKKPAID